jgi:DNA transposition AAA+ family ATPase
LKKGIFLETANVTRLRSVLAMAEDTETGRPGMMMITGETGIGKTVAAKNAHAIGGGVYLRVLEQMSQHDFLQALCFEIAGVRPHGSGRCKNRIIDEMGQAGANQTVYIDEADRLHRSRLEDLRDIHDLTGAPIVLIGEPGLSAQVASRARINNRIPAEFRVGFEPITTRDISMYASQAAGLKLTPDACAIVRQISRGIFRHAHNFIVSLDQMAKAAQTNKVDEVMARRLAPAKGGKK